MHTDITPPKENRPLAMCLRAPRWQVLAAAALLALPVAVLDWMSGLNVSLGVFYIFPVILAATVLTRLQIVGLAAICAALRVAFNPAPSTHDLILGFIMASIAYTGAGFFVAELVRNRMLVLGHMQQIRKQQALRLEAEEQLRILVESSPAAIMTLDGSGRMLAANRAAHDLLALDDGGTLIGQDVGQYIPVLADALKLDTGAGEFRTAAQCRGKRRNGELFIAHTWFSTYSGPGGRRLAAIAVDASEEMREREEQNLRQLLRSNRVIAGAVSHDIRNLCGGIGVVYSNLKRIEALHTNEDFKALGSLVDGLGRIAATDLRSRVKDEVGAVDLTSTLEQLRIIIEPAWQQTGGTLEWQVPDRTLFVVGEATGLLQAFLNLVQNSHRAVQMTSMQRLRILVHENSSKVVVRFSDSGPGLAEPQRLFQPFQPGAEASGIGLYVSRAILRSYGGELRYEPEAQECSFAVELCHSLADEPALARPR